MQLQHSAFAQSKITHLKIMCGHALWSGSENQHTCLQSLGLKALEFQDYVSERVCLVTLLRTPRYVANKESRISKKSGSCEILKGKDVAARPHHRTQSATVSSKFGNLGEAFGFKKLPNEHRSRTHYSQCRILEFKFILGRTDAAWRSQ